MSSLLSDQHLTARKTLEILDRGNRITELSAMFSPNSVIRLTDLDGAVHHPGVQSRPDSVVQSHHPLESPLNPPDWPLVGTFVLRELGYLGLKLPGDPTIPNPDDFLASTATPILEVGRPSVLAADHSLRRVHDLYLQQSRAIAPSQALHLSTHRQQVLVTLGVGADLSWQVGFLTWMAFAIIVAFCVIGALVWLWLTMLTVRREAQRQEPGDFRNVDSARLRRHRHRRTVRTGEWVPPGFTVTMSPGGGH